MTKNKNKNNNLVKHKLKGLKLKMSRKKNMTNDSDQKRYAVVADPTHAL